MRIDPIARGDSRGRNHASRLLLVACAVAIACIATVASAQPGVTSALNIESSGETATLTFFNRPIAVLRARAMGRGPADRAAAAGRMLDELAAQGVTGPIGTRPFEGGVLLTVNDRGVVAILSADLDSLSDETLDGVVAQTTGRLRQALQEAAEARTPGRLLRSAAATAAMTILALLLLWGIARVRRSVTGRIIAIEEKVSRSGIASVEALRASRVLDAQQNVVTIAATAASLTVIYAAAAFGLRQFPYTRPWGESMRGFLLDTAARLGLGIAHAIPGLFTAVVIFVLARFIVRLLSLWFNAAERGHVRIRWIYPETAQPTRRLASILVWLFAIVVAYPYLPGSQTEAFKGVSVFLGLMITFGSSGVVNQLMSGLMVTYSRALRVGDFVRIGDTEGVVGHLGLLSAKIKTLRNEEVTIPNAVVVSQTTTNYTRFGTTEGVFTPTSVTIGYDAPWRQVEALLLMAAERTSGLRREPKPLVIQSGLEDFYVKYTLLVCLERQESKPVTLDELHANIQDLFNEYGVQIMSPNYVLDPSAPKVVPKANWFAAPAGLAASNEPRAAAAQPTGSVR